jgi:hypothetical protein
MRVITFSTKFPATHPRKGEPTFFVEKIVKGLHEQGLRPFDVNCDFDEQMYYIANGKHHTIRAGERWKAGDWFSPRVWSGKPYASKQIEFAPPIQIKKVWKFTMRPSLWFDECEYFINGEKFGGDELEKVAENDGLGIVDFALWFAGKNAASTSRKPFNGQILCWNEAIEYCPVELQNAHGSVATKV